MLNGWIWVVIIAKEKKDPVVSIATTLRLSPSGKPVKAGVSVHAVKFICSKCGATLCW